ncbi:cupin domain-containing protein [Streptosporangium amethystogenes]|uniref:cupin domain-containing protein n=1 Tax=Streptosporangium amethystogenes TaxID=2002 RepID=UPI0007C86289|nr:cupin domain-containing protein [Streptosporangium amethystogenes]
MVTAAGAREALPGAVGLSWLRVYDWPAADGRSGGTPHVHLTCTEAYAVVEGRGAVQTIGEHGFTETPLEPGAVVWFTPGTIHRLVNDDGRLTVLVIMQNDGLPEAGDAFFPFPPEVLDDLDTYAEAARPPAYEEAARLRRDLAVAGFLALRESLAEGDRAPLDRFYRRAAELAAPRLDAWRDRWRTDALTAAARTGDLLDRLGHGDTRHLREAGLRRAGTATALGMCGRLEKIRLDPEVSTKLG